MNILYDFYRNNNNYIVFRSYSDETQTNSPSAFALVQPFPVVSVAVVFSDYARRSFEVFAHRVIQYYLCCYYEEAAVVVVAEDTEAAFAPAFVAAGRVVQKSDEAFGSFES
jgi:hypothetical protein